MQQLCDLCHSIVPTMEQYCQTRCCIS